MKKAYQISYEESLPTEIAHIKRVLLKTDTVKRKSTEQRKEKR